MISKFAFAVKFISISPLCWLSTPLLAAEVTTNYPSASFTIAVTNANGSVTQRATVLTNVDVNEIGTSFATNVANLVPTNLFTNKTFRAFTNSEIVAETVVLLEGAGKCFDDLKKQGHLPGISKDGHGYATVDDFSLTNFWASQVVRYPFFVTFNTASLGDSLTNHYTMELPAKDAQWKLKKAWRTDSAGHLMKEWHVN